MKFLLVAVITIVYFSHELSTASKNTEYFLMNNRMEVDTIVIGNKVQTPPNPGSKFMTNQDALIVEIPKQGIFLESIEIYYLALQPASIPNSKLWVKSADACTGGALSFSIDTFTIGISEITAIDTGWNHYSFEPPLKIDFDTIYIWPGYTSSPLPRVEYASGNNTRLNNFLCASPQFGISFLDYRCELIFTDRTDCPSHIIVTKYDSSCFAADTVNL